MSLDAPPETTRRSLLAAGAAAAFGAALPPTLARAAVPGVVSFQVWRKTAMIGAHAVTVRASPGGLTATIAAQFVVSIGPVPVFHYRHAATEVWKDGRFFSLDSHTVSNGIAQSVHAERVSGGVSIRAGGRPAVIGPEDASPLTHWNKASLDGPLFNPQTGALMPKERIQPLGARPVLLADGRMLPAQAFDLTGEASIIDWYDDAGTWAGLEAKVMDGSSVQYRRV